MTEVTHAPERSRFVTGDAYLEYAQDGATFTILHTVVPDAMSGQGVGGQLVRAALAHVRDQHLQLVVVCPFAKSWLEKHPDA